MTVELKLTFATLDELAAFMVGRQTQAAPTTKDAPAPKSQAAQKAAEQVASPSPAPAPTAPTEAAKPDAKAAPVTYEKSGIPEKIAGLVTKDRAAAVALLAEFGAKKGGELKPEQFADFTAKIDALLAVYREPA